MKNRKTNWDNSRFEYSDKKLKELQKELNVIFEMSKFKIKKKAMSKLNKTKKINYKNIKFEVEDFEKTVRDFYFNELNSKTFEYLEDVSKNAYNYAIEEVKKKFPTDKKIQEKELKEIKTSLLKKWLNEYISGLRIDYINNLNLQSIYFTYRLVDALNDNVEKNYSDKDNKQKSNDKILNMNTITMLLLYKIQKKKLANLIDNIFTYVVSMSYLEAYRQMGIQRVMRIAEIDNRTCEDCIELDGEVYVLGEEPEVMIHNFCRCYYVPYVEN